MSAGLTETENLDQEDLATPVVPSCDNCGAASKPHQAWCGICGYHPLTKTCMDLCDWDRDEPPVDRPPTTWEIWSRLIPTWGWKLMAGIGALIVANLALRLLVPHELQFYLAATEIIIGLVAFVVAHIGCYLYAIMDNAQLSILDILLKPFHLWTTTLKALPETFQRVATGVWGISAVLCSILIANAIPLAIDWGKEPPRRKLSIALKAHMAEQSADQGLEDSIRNFADTATVSDSKEREKDKKLSRPQSLDAVVIGYTPAKDGGFSSLILAGEKGGKLKYIGAVEEGISPAIRTKIAAQLPELERSSPFVPCSANAVWLNPVLTCRVRFKDWSPSERMQMPLFDDLLGI